MIGLAQKSGYGFLPAPYDWRLVRFEKALPHVAIGYPVRKLETGCARKLAVASRVVYSRLTLAR